MSASPAGLCGARIGAALGFDAAHGSRFQGAGYLHLHGQAKVEFLDRHYPESAWRRVFAIADLPSDSALLGAFERWEMV